jgi:hypothetical protein
MVHILLATKMVAEDGDGQERRLPEVVVTVMIKR